MFSFIYMRVMTIFLTHFIHMEIYALNDLGPEFSRPASHLIYSDASAFQVEQNKG